VANTISDDKPAQSSAQGSDLSSMLLPDLRKLAQGMGISGASTMRKGDLVSAIGQQGSDSARRRQIQ